MSAPAPERYGALARYLEALASPTRLELLHALRTPQALHEIRVTPSMVREGERPDRPLSRQGVSRHLEQLLEAGLVVRTAGHANRGESYVIHHERLFALVDEIRGVARLRSTISTGIGPTETMASAPPGAHARTAGPRLYVAFGRDDGVAFPLPARGHCVVGRASTCDVSLDYDPFASAEHARIERREGFSVEDLASRNGTWVNGERLDARETRGIGAGDVLTIGRTQLVLQL